MRDTRADGRAVDAAFNRVLGAEADARQAVAACRDEADARLIAADRDARGIAKRAERRIRAAHRIADRGIQRGLAELAADAAADETAVELEPATVEALAAALAAELTGGQP